MRDDVIIFNGNMGAIPEGVDALSINSQDEREDGEIVDDYEAISDSSILSCGKSDYSQDLLRAISLSSISDIEEPLHLTPKKNSRKRSRKTCRHDRRRKRKKRKSYDVYDSCDSYSSSDEEKLDKRTLRQLKEAVRINVTRDLHHNSLRTRLKGMIDPDSQEDDDVEALRTLALLTKQNSAKPDEAEDDVKMDEAAVNDKELTELRLEALKSAVIKKHMERKKRKEQGNPDVPFTNDVDNNDKENEKNHIINAADPLMNGAAAKVHQETSIEDDVDVMRAMLLASMSKKITSNIPKSTAPPATSTPIVRTNMHKKPIIIPAVKPLIIRLGPDSDSETDQLDDDKTEEPKKNPIDETVTRFLKMQREQFEAKQQNAKKTEVQSDAAVGDKSALNLLPEARQKEYQLLKQKMIQLAKKQKQKLLRHRRNSGVAAQNVGALKKTLEELQLQKDGRLQMKGKYKELGPLIKNVNEASERSKRCEEHIKDLLGQLKDARAELATSLDNFTELTKKLVKSKENIDLRLKKMLAKVNKPASPAGLAAPAKPLPDAPAQTKPTEQKLRPINTKPLAQPEQAKPPKPLIENPKPTIKKPPIEKSKALVEKSKAPIEKPKAPIEKPKAPIEKSKAPIAKPKAPIEKSKASMEKIKTPIEKPKNLIEKLKPLIDKPPPIEKSKTQIEQPKNPMERPNNPMERPKNPMERPKNPMERPQNPMERSQNPIEKPKSSIEKPLTDKPKVPPEKPQPPEIPQLAVVPAKEEPAVTMETVPAKQPQETGKYSEYVSPLNKRSTGTPRNPMQLLCPYELFGVCKDPDCAYNHCP